ncbi:glycosyltransferase [Pseudoalteromonas sp. SWXJ133]|uniref:glycosyltransferase n=1 Tax=Pseudoalteromonas sp. SWXJ133 TaxID=2792069 RepID=UPI0018CE7220|nr:glycosyltransferase [Pseudoalteromonas sp. SWXJ133]MBH0019492.1 glycosyltransferase [Pseudoalteromonas sp. SWXJ133]
MKFSVLMSIYKNEKVDFFIRCMESIWDEQTTKPAEITLVIDGPLYDELYQSIDMWREKLGDVFCVVPLEHNLGLGNALNIGLSHCKNELIARMDTDDIALPSRFEKQLAVFENKNIDVCGSWVSEFIDVEQNIISYRKVPEERNEIELFLKSNNPFNHPSVMYKKSSVIKAGNYQKMLWFEDYSLWARMKHKSALFYNIQEPLVNMRAGYEQLERRRGLQYALSEIKLQKSLLSLGIISYREYCRNVCVRFCVRLAPKAVVKLAYKLIRNRKL